MTDWQAFPIDFSSHPSLARHGALTPRERYEEEKERKKERKRERKRERREREITSRPRNPSNPNTPQPLSYPSLAHLQSTSYTPPTPRQLQHGRRQARRGCRAGAWDTGGTRTRPPRPLALMGHDDAGTLFPLPQRDHVLAPAGKSAERKVLRVIRGTMKGERGGGIAREREREREKDAAATHTWHSPYRACKYVSRQG